VYVRATVVLFGVFGPLVERGVASELTKAWPGWPILDSKGGVAITQVIPDPGARNS
jgi:hypothetical protein